MSDELEQLRTENAEYHSQMQELNEEMDRMLLKREKPGAKKKKGGANQEASQEKPYELRQAIAKNEQLRKERLKWWAEITHSDTAIRIAETRNELGTVEQKIASVKADIQGLENIKRNQQGVVDVAKHATDEVKYLEAQHRAETQDFRDQWRALNDENKAAEKMLSSHQNRYHTAQEKLKLGLDSTDVDELRTTVDAQGTEIEELLSKLEDLQSEHSSVRKQNHKGIDSHTREKQSLQKELDAAKATLIERERELKLSYARGNRLGLTSPATPTTAAA